MLSVAKSISRFLNKQQYWAYKFFSSIYCQSRRILWTRLRDVITLLGHY